ncbi:uncharacterized protein LOC114841432 [Diachasma alloeum]|uniref:Gustatory receptor n=1 Tax=Diachasma alloeum TaxID=454923 RepID=A0A4E0RMZ5_9HYME|nr:uncharacterized protein LOC114841432 [Diachasma alloeum]THK33148.1 gustatory receptor 22 [Diachasma alloeum]
MDRETSVLFRSITAIFKTFGLLPFTITVPSTSKKGIDISPSRGTVAYNVLFFAAVLYANCFAGIPIIIRHAKSKLQDTQVILDILHTIMASGISLMTLAMFNARRAKMMNMTRDFLEVDRCIKRHRHIQSLKFSPRPLTVFIILYIIMWIVLVSTEWHEDFVAAPKMQWLLWGFTYLVPVVIITLCVLQYGVIMKLVAFRFKLLNHTIRKSTDTIAHCLNQNETFILPESAGDRVIVHKFRSIKSAHESLYDFTIAVSHFYSFLILPIIGFFCGTFIFLSFDFMMNAMSSKNEGNTISNYVAWILIVITPMVILLSNIEAATEEYERTPIELYKLASRFESCRELATEVELFSHDFLHKKMKLSALGCFPLDYTVFHSILSATLTYLIIIFQFQESRRMASKKPANLTST